MQVETNKIVVRKLFGEPVEYEIPKVVYDHIEYLVNLAKNGKIPDFKLVTRELFQDPVVYQFPRDLNNYIYTMCNRNCIQSYRV